MHPLRPWLLVLSRLWTHYIHRELPRALAHVKFTCTRYSKPVTKNRACTAEIVGSPEMREGVEMQLPSSGGARVRGFSSPSPQTIHSPTLFMPSLHHHSLQWPLFSTVEPQHIIIQNTSDLKLALKKHFQIPQYLSYCITHGVYVHHFPCLKNPHLPSNF